MAKTEECTTCSVKLVREGNIKIPCAKCGQEIGRCEACRKLGNLYKCPKCGFVGP